MRLDTSVDPGTPLDPTVHLGGNAMQSYNAKPRQVGYGAYSATLTPMNRRGVDGLAGVPLLAEHPSFAPTSIFPFGHNIPEIMASFGSSRVAPITRLPDDILSYIFILALYREEPPHDNLIHMNPFHGFAFPWIVHRVCLKWKHIAVNTSELWQNIRVCTEPPCLSNWVVQGGNEALQYWVSKAPHFVDVHLRTSMDGFNSLDKSTLHSLLHHSRSFRSLRLEIHGVNALQEIFSKGVYVPLLETFHVSFFGETEQIATWIAQFERIMRPPNRVFPPLFRYCPRLRRCTFEESSAAFRLFTLPLHQLDSLDMIYTAPGHEHVGWGLSMLPIQGHLTSLKIHFASTPTIGHVQSLAGFLSHSIRKLEYSAPGDFIISGERPAHLFEKLHLPNLQELVLRDDYHPCAFIAARDLVKRSGASLSHLGVFGTLFRPGDDVCANKPVQFLQKLLKKVQGSLKSLTIGADPVEADHAFMNCWFSLGDHPLPHLKEFTVILRTSSHPSRLGNYLRSHRALCLRAFLDFVETRWPLAAGQRGFGGHRQAAREPPTPLERFTLVFHTSDFDLEEIEEAILKDFKRGNVQAVLARVENEPKLVVVGHEGVLTDPSFCSPRELC
ncbi:hypothetical protein V5O48_004836 [Marasmius crinis-equi]|uniref:F-box domain-containing protein n=1 Tax=Marasmius crinis-equi TaxID=585013 RepID=A0ABR3FNZ6_9AGAR